MSIDTEQTHQTPRRRSGLAKLRGDDAVVAPEQREDVNDSALQTLPESPVQLRGEAAPEVAAAPTGTAESEAPEKRQRAWRGKLAGRRLQLAVIALVAVVAVLATFVVSGWDRLTGGGSSAGPAPAAAASANDRFAALRAGRQFAVSFFTYDYRKLDDYFRRIEGGSTGSFKADFVSKEKVLRQTLAQLKTVATGHVADAGAGISQISGNNAVALVAADFDASNAVTKNGQKRYRVKLALQRVNGVWLVSDFEQVV